MPKVSKSSAKTNDMGPVCDHEAELGEYVINFVEFRQDIDGTPLLKGLPDDRCQCPHWGYVVKGKITMRFPHGDEVYEAGDAFYTPPGHIPLAEAGTEYVQFSPTLEHQAVAAAMMKNMQEAQRA